MTVELRPKQAALRDAVREAMRTHKSVLMQAPCAFGKTFILSDIVNRAYAKGNRVIFGVHRKELIQQTAATFDKYGFPYSFIAPGRQCDPRAQVYIASIPTLRNRLGKFPTDVLLVDEAHLSMADGWHRTILHYRQSGAWIIGCSASPQRLDGKGLHANFDYLVPGSQVREAIEDGSLCGYRLFAPFRPDTSGLHILAGDFRKDEAEGLMNKASITGNAVSHWLSHASGKRTVAYCVSREHSKAVAASFRDRGVSAFHVDGETHDEVRSGALRDLADGKLQVVTNCQLFTEGVDLGALAGRDVTIECVVNLRPTQSLALWTQICGRAFRPKSEPAIILDHAGVSLTLGLPDEPRQWSLDGEVKKSKPKAPSVRVCPSCWRALPSATRECPAPCGHIFAVESRTIRELDGELAELTAEEFERRQQRRAEGFERYQSQTLDQLRAFAKKKNYKPGWAERVYAARLAKKLASP